MKTLWEDSWPPVRVSVPDRSQVERAQMSTTLSVCPECWGFPKGRGSICCPKLGTQMVPNLMCMSLFAHRHAEPPRLFMQHDFLTLRVCVPGRMLISGLRPEIGILPGTHTRNPNLFAHPPGQCFSRPSCLVESRQGEDRLAGRIHHVMRRCLAKIFPKTARNDHIT